MRVFGLHLSELLTLQNQADSAFRLSRFSLTFSLTSELTTVPPGDLFLGNPLLRPSIHCSQYGRSNRSLLSMLPVTSGNYSSRRDKSVFSTAIRQLKRRFGRKVRRALRKRRVLFCGLALIVLLVWWSLSRPALKAVVIAQSLVATCVRQECGSAPDIDHCCYA